MDTVIRYIVNGYMILGVFLVFLAAYLSERLKRYIDIKYPQEGKIIRSYEWLRWPWSKGQKTLKALIRKQSSNDVELSRKAKKAMLSSFFLLEWVVLFLIIFFSRLLFLISR